MSYEIRELNPETGAGLIVDVRDGKEYPLSRYSGRTQCAHGFSTGCTHSVAKAMLTLSHEDFKELKNPRGYSHIVIWKCGTASWVNELPGFNISNLFFDD